jgi:hypothetical protein
MDYSWKIAALVVLTVALFILLVSLLSAQPKPRCVTRAMIIKDVVAETAKKTGTAMSSRDFDGEDFDSFKAVVTKVMTNTPRPLERATGVTVIFTKQKSGSVIVVHFENRCAFSISFIPVGLYYMILNVVDGQAL